MTGAISDEVPKAILYIWPDSVWSTVPRLCLHEKGYGEDEYMIKLVDITKGENFSPSYLKINYNGTVPTLVVPTSETTGPEVASRYRSLRDTLTICDFLDQARSINTANTTSPLPAPALAPATIEGKTMSDTMIALVHLPLVDPNFLHLSARSNEELAAKANSAQGQYLSQRQQALEKFVGEARAIGASTVGGAEVVEGKAPTYEQKMVKFLEEKLVANGLLLEVYKAPEGDEKREAFIRASTTAWTESVPDVLQKLDKHLKGPFALGDHVSLADLHIIAWLTRLIGTAGGDTSASGITALEDRFEGKKIGPNIIAFWEKWLERESFKKCYIDGPH